MSSSGATDSVFTDSAKSLRWAVYWLMMAWAASAITGRIMQVSSGSRNDPTPFLSANDRSRWCTVRALVDDGTYAIDHIIFQENGQRNRAWHTIDLVRHRGSDGKDHYYSSKPTLLSTLIAGEYYVLKKLTGAEISKKPFFVGQMLLLLTNVVPLLLAWLCMADLIERYGTTDVGRLFVMAVITAGTFLTTFAVTLNNHLPAALGVIFTIWFAEPLWKGRSSEFWRYAGAGLMAAFTATCELPAMAFLALVGAGLALTSFPRTLFAFAPAAIAVAAAAVGTNYIAHGTFSTPYAYRSDGPKVARIPLSNQVADLDARKIPAELQKELPDAFAVETRVAGLRWAISDKAGGTRWAVVAVPASGKVSYASLPDLLPSDAAVTELEIRQWKYWYDYPGTYWTPNVERTSVDRGEANRLVYALHVLIGHHGIFSLSPVWLLSLVGLSIVLYHGRGRDWQANAATLLLFAVVLAFYLSRSQVDRNYGGFCCGLRWMFWFIPIWTLQLLPIMDRLARSKWGISPGIVCLTISVFSAHYANLNPWQHPWLFDYWTYLGWIDYP
ncbi:MAG: hypothetical protein ACO1RA_01565 [Planctomycetaceae bacterium]